MKVYEELGLTKDQYIYRGQKGLLPRKNKRHDERYSGLVYENSPQRIAEIMADPVRHEEFLVKQRAYRERKKGM